MRIPIRRIVRGFWYGRRRPLVNESHPISPAIEQLLSQPTWSVRSLLPPSKPKTNREPLKNEDEPPSDPTLDLQYQTSADDEITPAKLHHLLRLSALPPPKSPDEEATMLQTLRDQVHFVKAIQSVDTSAVTPLITLRDETHEAVHETMITLEKMMPYLELEEKVGKNGTIRRRDVERSEEQDQTDRAGWEIDVGNLGQGSEERRMGRFFFVKRAKKEQKVEEEQRVDGT